jgi:hypothetical protein
VLSYDYTVLAGTQGALGHRKKDRLFELIERMRLPTSSSPRAAAGGPATPTTRSSRRSTRARSRSGRGSRARARGSRSSPAAASPQRGPRRLLGLIVATENVSLGMERAGDDRGRRPGHGRCGRDRAAGDAGPPNGVIDVVAADEAEADGG